MWRGRLFSGVPNGESVTVNAGQKFRFRIKKERTFPYIVHLECFTCELDMIRLVSIFPSHPSPSLPLWLSSVEEKKPKLPTLLKVDKDLFLLLETGACYVAQSCLERSLFLECFLNLLYLAYACIHVHRCVWVHLPMPRPVANS